MFTNLTGRTALTIRLVGLALVSWTVLTASHHPPGDSGRGLVISVLFVVCVVAWLMRVRSPAAAYRAIRAVPDRDLTPGARGGRRGSLRRVAGPKRPRHVGSDARVRTKASLDAPVAAHLLFATSRCARLLLLFPPGSV